MLLKKLSCVFADNFFFSQIFINSIFPEGEDVSMCISHAANSIGLKEIPQYEVTMGEQYDWIKKTQVDILTCNLP